MNVWMISAVVALTLYSSAVLSQTTIPLGAVLPVQLNSSLNSRKSKPGERVTARIMQDVRLSSSGKIREGAKVLGYVVSVKAFRAGQRAEIALHFDRLEFAHQTVRVSTNLRALASMMEVEYAQVPPTGPDRGTPWGWTTRNLIGGEVAYGEGGPVVHGAHQVGKALVNGVLIPVRPNPLLGCRGEVAGNAEPQPLWVFSSDACGVYGFGDLEIAHSGRTAPIGDITLASKEGDFNLRSGSGMLLRVIGINLE